MIKLNHLIKEHLLYEGLIYSVSIEKFQEMIDRWFNFNNIIVITTSKDNKIKLDLRENISPETFKLLFKFINNMGWFISAYLIISDNGLKWKKFNVDNIKEKIISLQVEAKFDLEVTETTSDILYHISPSINDKKIEKIGLVPKTLNKISYHPERIYFGETEDDVEVLLSAFIKTNKDIKQYSIYEIQISKSIKNNKQLRLFKDPNSIRGIYTLSNILPQHIKLVRTINL